MRRRAAAVVLALAAIFVAAPAALAENDTSQDGYGGQPIVQVILEESAEVAAPEVAVPEVAAPEVAAPEVAAPEGTAEEQSASPEEAFRPPVAKSAGTQAASTTTARPASTQAEAAATLPVTGAELAFVFGAGALLVLVGFGMNRLARPRRTVR